MSVSAIDASQLSSVPGKTTTNLDHGFKKQKTESDKKKAPYRPSITAHNAIHFQTDFYVDKQKSTNKIDFTTVVKFIWPLQKHKCHSPLTFLHCRQQLNLH